MGQKLGEIIKEIPSLKLHYPVETNQVFFSAPSELIAPIQEKIGCYLWDYEKSEIRFVASWYTTEQDLEQARLILKDF